MLSAHLPPERWYSASPEPEEQAHLAVCLACRSVWRTRPGAPVRLGPYEVLGELGQGGMGEVLAVRHPRTREQRAIKRAGERALSRERLAREARLQRRVDHPNVLALLDVVQLPEGLALVLPWVEGPTLQTLLQKARP